MKLNIKIAGLVLATTSAGVGVAAALAEREPVQIPAAAIGAPITRANLAGTTSQAGMATLDSGFRFEANRGQFDERVRYLARGRGYGLFLTPDKATLTLRRPQGAPAVVTMRLRGARKVEPVGQGELPGRSNYFIGADRSKWRTGVPSFGRVRYPGVLPGVDLEFYGTGERQAEYDLILAPGADPGRLALEFEGLKGIDIDAEGDAVLKLAGGGEVRKPLPVAYQMDEDGRRTLVAARYQRRGKDRLGFVVSGYDRRRSLVIDPVFVYSTLLGGGASDSAQGIAIDGSGNAYVVGRTVSPDFPVVAAFQGTNRNLVGGNVFVSKLAASGAPNLVYSTYLGGSNGEGGTSVWASRWMDRECLRDRGGEQHRLSHPGAAAGHAERDQRRVRDQAQRQRGGPGLLHLPRWRGIGDARWDRGGLRRKRLPDR